MLRLLFSAFGMHAHRSPRIHCDGVELAGSADTDTLVFFAMHFRGRVLAAPACAT